MSIIHVAERFRDAPSADLFVYFQNTIFVGHRGYLWLIARAHRRALNKNLVTCKLLIVNGLEQRLRSVTKKLRVSKSVTC